MGVHSPSPPFLAIEGGLGKRKKIVQYKRSTSTCNGIFSSESGDVTIKKIL